MSLDQAPKEVGEYFAGLPDYARVTLETLRQTIKELAPEAEEAMSYGMPAFKHRGRPLAGYSASKGHCSYFPMSSGVMERLAGDLAGYKTSKGGFRFPIGEPPPAALVDKLLKARKDEISGQ